MDTLYFKKATRKGDNKGTTERHFLDFIISGKSLKTILGMEDSDFLGMDESNFITPFGWTNDEKYEKQIKNSFKLQRKPELRTGRDPYTFVPNVVILAAGLLL